MKLTFYMSSFAHSSSACESVLRYIPPSFLILQNVGFRLCFVPGEDYLKDKTQLLGKAQEIPPKVRNGNR